MSVADLHPDALLDKEAAGTLEERDRALLQSHLERCEACRFELKVRDDFAREIADSVRVPDLRGLPELLARTPARPLRHVSRSFIRARPAARATWLVAVAVALGASVALCAVLRTRVLPRYASGAVPSRVTAVAPTRAAEAARLAPAEPEVSPETSRWVDAVPIDSPPVAPVPVESEAAKHAAAALPTRELGAVELFDAESHARRRGEYVRALSLHRELEARFGLSKEAQASRAVTGRLLLDRGNADAALACFDSYLASGSGDLGEEVLVGRATALEKLSQMDEARAAWQDLLERFPTTPYAPHAKARLGI